MGFAGTRALPLGKVKYKVLVVLPFGKRKKKKNPREKLLPYSKVTENQNILRIEKPRACYTVTGSRNIYEMESERGLGVGIDVWKTVSQVQP